jgi:hypothetical protein
MLHSTKWHVHHMSLSQLLSLWTLTVLLGALHRVAAAQPTRQNLATLRRQRGCSRTHSAAIPGHIFHERIVSGAPRILEAPLSVPAAERSQISCT